MSKTEASPAKQAILEVLKVEPQASVVQIAVSAGVGRSTAGKLPAQLESDGEVRRAGGGRDGNRRLPDLWSLAGQQPAANDTGAKTRWLGSVAPSIAVQLVPVVLHRSHW